MTQSQPNQYEPCYSGVFLKGKAHNLCSICGRKEEEHFPKRPNQYEDKEPTNTKASMHSCQSTGEHYYASERNGGMPIWVRRCMICGLYDIKDMNEQLEQLITQKQLEARKADFNRMHDYYGRGNIKLWDEPDNNQNPVYLDDHIAELTKQKGK